MRNIAKLAGGLAVGAAALTSPVSAQQGMKMPDMGAMHCGVMTMPGMSDAAHAKTPDASHAMPGMGGMSSMGDMMHMMGPPSAAMILEHSKDIKLSDAQVSRLQAIQKQAQPECTRHMTMAMASHAAANKLLEAPSPDFTAFAAKLREATSHMVESQLVMAKHAVAARSVLTAAQQRTLKEKMDAMHKQPMDPKHKM